MKEVREQILSLLLAACHKSHLLLVIGQRSVLCLELLEHRVKVEAPAVVDEIAAQVSLRLGPQYLGNRFEVLAVLANTCVNIRGQGPCGFGRLMRLTLHRQQQLVMRPASVDAARRVCRSHVTQAFHGAPLQPTDTLLVVLHLQTKDKFTYKINNRLNHK